MSGEERETETVSSADELSAEPNALTKSEHLPPTIQAEIADQPIRVVKANSEASSGWDAPTKRTVLVILLIAGVATLWISRSVLPLLIVAGIVAYFLSPIVSLAERVRIPRGVSTAVLFILLLVGLILTPIIVVPILIGQLEQLNFNVYASTVQLTNWIQENFQNFVSSVPETLNVLGFNLRTGEMVDSIGSTLGSEEVLQTSTSELLSGLQRIINTATSTLSLTAGISFALVGGILGFFITFILIFFLSLYLTKDAPRIRNYVEGLFPKSYHSEVEAVIRRMGSIWSAFFRGQIFLALTVGTITWLVLLALGMPGALILGIVAGLLEVIPNLGPILAMIPALIVALIEGTDSELLLAMGVNNVGFAIITVATYFIIQQLENSILVPRIIGDSVNLHPVVIICGVFVGFNIAGVLGAFLAAPVMASLRVLGGYVHAKLLDYPPFEDAQSRTAISGRSSRQLSLPFLNDNKQKLVDSERAPGKRRLSWPRRRRRASV